MSDLGKTFVVLLLLCSSLLQASGMGQEQKKDIYIIIYMTRTGFSGHVGMAVDNYKILVSDEWENGVLKVRYDTVKDGTLTYYDLWGPANVAFGTYNKNLEARYFKLPRTSAEPRISVRTFLEKGLPHSFDYPCDALIRVPTGPSQDNRLEDIVDAIQTQYDYFNVRQYNCTDFVIQALNSLMGTELEAKEYIPFTWSSTPNRLYREVVKQLPVHILREPGPGIEKSFYQERILNTILSQKKSTTNEKNQN